MSVAPTPPRVSRPWSWTEVDCLGCHNPAYRTTELDSVEVCRDLDGIDVVLITEDTTSEQMLESAGAPAAVVLAAMIRHYGRDVVVEWARTLELDPEREPEQGDLFDGPEPARDE